jgi:hypothetical protein
MIRGECHCGAVAFELSRQPEEATSCNCSICRRSGMLCAYFEPGEVWWRSPEGATESYVWGERTIEFHRCRVCGVATHWSPIPGRAPANRMGLNARLLPLEILESLKIRRFDGARTWKFVED